MANIRTTPEGAEALRRLVGRMQAETGATVTIGAALLAACAVASEHIDETVAAFRPIDPRKERS